MHAVKIELKSRSPVKSFIYTIYKLQLLPDTRRLPSSLTRTTPSLPCWSRRGEEWQVLEGWQTGHQEDNGLPWRPTLAASTQWRRGLAGSSITFEGGALRSSSKSTLWMRLRWVARVLALANVALAHVQIGEKRTVL